MNDRELRQLVVDELDWEPSVNNADVGVGVDAGVVALTGHVRTFAEKITLEKIVSRVKGVRAVTMDVNVKYVASNALDDCKVAERVSLTLEWNVLVPSHTISFEVDKGWVSLTGVVDWQYQKVAAEASLRKLMGVVGVNNQITVKPLGKMQAIKQKISDAIKRNAELDAAAIRVIVNKDTVTLEGKVKAWHERQIAERAAWSAPGVSMVEDRLIVD